MNSANLFVLCLPSKCSEEDIKTVLKAREFGHLIKPLEISLYSSQAPDEDSFKEFYPIPKIAVLVLMTIIALNFYATWTENTLTSKVLQCFNISVNHGKLTGPCRQLEDERLYFYNVFKAAYLLLGFIGHSLAPISLVYTPLVMPVFWQFRDSFTPYTFHSGFLGVSSNTIATSSLAAITLIPIIDRISLSKVLVARIVRTIPVVILAMAIQLVIPAMSPSKSGPMFDAIYRNLTSNCLQHGWKELLMMGNFLKFSEHCVAVSWFVSLDFQMFVLCFVLMVILKRSFRTGTIFATLQISIGLLLHYYQTGTTSRPYNLILSESDHNISENWPSKYTHPVANIVPYTIGVLLGYAVLNTKSMKSNWKVGWSSFLIAIGIIVISGAGFYDRNGVPRVSEPVEKVWNVLQKPLFCLAMAIAFYYGLMGSERVKRMGKSQLATVLSRITFTSYLFNNIFTIYLMATKKQPIDPDGINVAGHLLYVSISSMVGGYLMSLFFEVPVANLFKLLIIDKSRAIAVNGKKE